LVAPDAARTAVGIVATIYAMAGTETRHAELVQLANPADRERFAVVLAPMGVDPDAVVRALLALLPLVEAGLRSQGRRAHTSPPTTDPPPDAGDAAGDGSQPEPQRPLIQTNARFMRDISQDCLNVLQQINRPDPKVYARGGALVWLRRDAVLVSAEPLSQPTLKGLLDRHANFVTVKDDIVPARPPDDVIKDLLNLPTFPLPELRGIASAPLVLPGGHFLLANGYDPASGIYLACRDLGAVRSDLPLAEARHWLLTELLGDFPFADAGSLAHTVALCLERLVRELISGPTPLYLIDAPERGTGKGLLAEVCAWLALGEPAWVMAEPGDEAETRKRITSLLLEGRQMVLLDNVHTIRSGVFAALLTTIAWEDRLLGVNKTVRVRNAATWLATGNNVGLSDEIVRRVVPIRLDAGVERPEERTGFRHPDLTSWTRQHRTELVSACLSLIRAWVDAGSPAGTATLGRFEGWATVMGGILAVAEIPGFLSNRERLHAVSDPETREWQRVCQLWAERFGLAPITASDLLDIVTETNLLVDLRAGRSKLAAQQRLGHALQARVDRVFGPWRICAAEEDGRTGNHAYRLEPRKLPEIDSDENTRNTRNTADPAVPTGVSGVSGVLPAADFAPDPTDVSQPMEQGRWLL
jgi:hypothetical protein